MELYDILLVEIALIRLCSMYMQFALVAVGL